MYFQPSLKPPLQHELNALSSALCSPRMHITERFSLSRRTRLAVLRHQRLALSRWRELCRAMEYSGVPGIRARIKVHSGPPSFQWHGQLGASVLLPANWKDMPRSLDPEYPNHPPGFYFQALTLLHEWGHSIIHPPSDLDWVAHLSGQAREHAHPAFSHVGEYAGWRVFNEIFADAFACAWMLRLFDRNPKVVQALMSLRRQREFAVRQKNSVNFPCYHNTSDIIGRVLYQQWDCPVEEIQPRLLLECCQSFDQWYTKGPVTGEDICASSLSHIKMLDKEFKNTRQAFYMYGRAWRSIGQPKNSDSDRLLDLLALDQPDHFLLSLSAVLDVYQPPALTTPEVVE